MISDHSVHAEMAPLAAAVLPPRRSFSLWGLAGPFVLGTVLFVLNNLGGLAGWLYPPDGYVPNFMPRNTDSGQYLTWIRAFRTQILIPDFNAPWHTDPALFNPSLWLISRIGVFLHIDSRTAYFLLHYLFYLMAAYALLLAIRAFTDSAAQARAALIAIVLAVPVQCLLVLPALLVPHRTWLPPLPGIGDFVWWSSDGFFHGISGSALVTFGTAATLLAFGLIARYLKTGQRWYLAGASVTACISAAFHPFEVCVIASAGPLTLLIRHGKNWRRGIPDALLLGISGAAGLLPYLALTMRHQWLRDAAAGNFWTPYSPPRLLVMLGLPMILGLALWSFRPRGSAGTDLLLRSWVGCTLIGVYVPHMPHSQHLLDGVHYAGALLLVREAVRSDLFARIRASYRTPGFAALAALCVLSIAPYIAYYRQSFLDGHSAQPAYLFSTVARRDEVLAIAWMQQHAASDQLVLAPRDSAPWFATPPMHSLASHQVFGVSYEEQARFADAFFAGELGLEAARGKLSEYGVRYVVLPRGSGAAAYLRDSVERANFGSLTIYEIPGQDMKPYGERPTLSGSAPPTAAPGL